jgi:hypothetical protein
MRNSQLIHEINGLESYTKVMEEEQIKRTNAVIINPRRGKIMRGNLK